MTASCHTAITQEGCGIVVVGQPAHVDRLIAKMRLIQMESVCLMTDFGICWVRPQGPWECVDA